MKKLSFFLLAATGLMNLYPLIGVISSDQLTSLYGIDINTPDLETLMRHRAVMLGLIGGFMVLSAFRSSLRMIAASMGLISMSSFVVLAYLSGEVGAKVNNVVVADIVGSIAIAVVLVICAFEEKKTA